MNSLVEYGPQKLKCGVLLPAACDGGLENACVTLKLQYNPRFLNPKTVEARLISFREQLFVH